MKHILSILAILSAFFAQGQIRYDTLYGKQYMYIQSVKYTRTDNHNVDRLYAFTTNDNGTNSAYVVGQVGYQLSPGTHVHVNEGSPWRQSFLMNPTEYSAWKSIGDSYLFSYLQTAMNVTLSDTLAPSSPDTSVHITSSMTFNETHATDFAIYPISGKMLEQVVFKTTSDTMNIKVGWSPGAQDVMPPTPTSTTGTVLDANYYATSSAPLYVSGVTGTLTVIYYIK